MHDFSDKIKILPEIKLNGINKFSELKLLCLPISQPRVVIGVFLFLLFSSNNASPQSVQDSIERAHSPAKATVFSALLPGAGQFYNRKYWKIPVIYGAFAGLGYLIKFNNDRFQTYRDAFVLRTDGDPLTVDEFEGRYSESDLTTLKDFYRRNRDLSFIFAGLIYVLNIVDASVDAHLFYFDVSDDLSLRIDFFFQHHNW